MENWQKSAGQDFSTIKAGSPSSYWSRGLDKRLNLISSDIDLKHKKILDVGCGLGAFMAKFQDYSKEVYGVEPDKKKVDIAKSKGLNVFESGAENMPFEDNYFDVVLLHEVIEHVDDDTKTIAECLRVLNNNGYIVIFCPNRLYPFETHGVYLNGKYYFGNKFLVPYLPYFYKKLTPHVRNYFKNDLLNLFTNSSVEIIKNSYVFPGVDTFTSRHKVIGPIIKNIIRLFENTPLKVFGISHYLIAKKV